MLFLGRIRSPSYEFRSVLSQSDRSMKPMRCFCRCDCVMCWLFECTEVRIAATYCNAQPGTSMSSEQSKICQIAAPPITSLSKLLFTAQCSAQQDHNVADQHLLWVDLIVFLNHYLRWTRQTLISHHLWLDKHTKQRVTIIHGLGCSSKYKAQFNCQRA